MKLQFTAKDLNSGQSIASGEIEYPEDMPARFVLQDIQEKAVQIAFSILDVEFTFSSEKEKEAFEKRLNKEMSGPKILGADGEPVSDQPKILRLLS